ncbi:hypothetical protein V7127_23350, partial [Bacillus sp. JJ1773]|uniref:hypothetical protein n=1 Tax=Bacillus sp. JJ1773 TaxID=3122965 RepID=UPI002FFF7165
EKRQYQRDPYPSLKKWKELQFIDLWNGLTGLRSVSVLALPNYFHTLWCSTNFVLHGWLTGAFL